MVHIRFLSFAQVILILAFFSDATSSGEAANLQNRLRSLSSGLAGLRNSLHDQQQQPQTAAEQQQQQQTEQLPPPPQQQNYCNVETAVGTGAVHAVPAVAVSNAPTGLIAPLQASQSQNGFHVGKSSGYLSACLKYF